MSDLEGTLVVSLEQAVAAPYVSGRLAEAGARVIKVERPEGDFARRYDDFVQGQSAYFVWLNAGKESVTLDLRLDDDRQLLTNMLARADVFIQNLAPGAADRLGFGAAALHRRHPDLIICVISGYGETGPGRNQKAYDLLIQAESGLSAVTGTADSPARVGVSVSDIAAGMTAYQSILQALIGRGKSGGKGRIIQVSLFHATADWMNVPYLQYRYGNFAAGRPGLQHPSIAPYGAFPCADNRQVLIAIQNEREWQSLCDRILAPDITADNKKFATNTLRLEHRKELDQLLAEKFRQRSRDENMALLYEANIACGRLSDLDDLLVHPQNRFREIITEGGTVTALARGATIAGDTEPALRLPTIGEHNEAIRKEFG